MWWWILIWALLLLGAAAVLGLLVWKSVIKRGIALGRQLGESSDLVSRALEPVSEPYRPDPSVLVDPNATPDAPRNGSGSQGRVRR
ncbi:hypothetical protein [Angustibacter luteus]|uniref:Uncharacterized protein n=1 Tax=Angustibacter luteus TaxID=658456 RepID=A0ABW1JAN6_9ACTN